MKIKRLFGVIIAISAVMTISHSSFAQSGMGGPGNQGYQRMYDTATVQTLRGEVVAVDTVRAGHGPGAGIHLTLKTDSTSVGVHLGPGWYLESQSVKVIAGDRITVTGSRVVFQGKPVIVAAEVRKGERILSLRNSQGYPLWSGGDR